MGCPPLCSDDLITTAAPLVIISSESACIEFGGTLTGGLFSAPTGSCPAGSTLEYSTDNVNWTTTLPIYNQALPITAYSRCTCIGDDLVTSMVSSVTSAPGACPICPELTAVAPVVLISSESTCSEFGGTLNGGVIDAPVNACPEGSTIMYSINGSPFMVALPTYDQIDALTIQTRCDCIDGIEKSPVSTVITIPGSCPLFEPLDMDISITCLLYTSPSPRDRG